MAWVKLIVDLFRFAPEIIKAISSLVFMIQEHNRKQKREKSQAEAKAAYDAVLADPNKTEEEKAKAYGEYINS